MLNKLKSIKAKIFIGYLLVALILVGVTFWSIVNFTSLSDAINNIMVENYRSIKASESMIESIERQDSAILVMINGPTEEGRRTFRQNEQDFYKWLARAEDNITIDGEAEIIGRTSSKYSTYINRFDEFYHLPVDTKWEFYNDELLPLFETIKHEIRSLRDLNQEQMVFAQGRADNRAKGAVISASIISLIAIILAIGFGLYLSNQILKPVNKLKGAIQKIAERNFEQKIDVYSDDEIGELANEFNKMIDRLQDYEKINISKLIAEKEKSEVIVNNISSPIIVTDDENRVVLLNDAARVLFEIKKEVVDNYHFLEIIKNEELFELIKADDDNNHINNNKTLDIERNNTELHFNISSNKVRKNGEVRFTVTLMEDVTKLKKVDEMKSEFVSTVSHEFRTPLTSMNMGLSMLLGEDIGPINEDQNQLLEAAFEDCERLNELVNDLLDLSKIESGKIKMEFDKADVQKIIASTVRPFSKQAEEKGVNLLVDEMEEKIYAWADPNKVSWVISNLIGNALRYTAEEGSIKVGSFLQGRNVYIYVEDTGIGISKEYRDKIFDKFVRASNNEDENSGTGLGLAISKEIIEAHQGRIWVESEEGEGSKFIFTLSRYRHLSEK